MRTWTEILVERELAKSGIGRKVRGIATVVAAGSLAHHALKHDEVPVASTEQTSSYSNEAAQLLALTMWGEARSTGIDGMRAVGHVILNRANSSRNFGDSIKEVVWKAKHFSCWNPGDPNRAAMERISSMPESSAGKIRYRQAYKLAKDILSGRDPDNTHGALFYHTENIKPNWSPDEEPVARIGGHEFYRTDKKA